MRAVVLAGGKGTRLRPYTSVLPKPLLPVGNRPIVEIVLRQLKKAGIRRATLAVGHMADMFPQVLNSGTIKGLRVDYARESRPRGTAAPLRDIKGLGQTFLVMNGDILTDLNYKDLIKYHKAKGAAATIATYRRHVPVDFGVVECGSDGLIQDYHEKPKLSYKVSMGIYIFEPRVVDYIPRRGRYDFPDLVEKLLDHGEPVAAYPFRGRWLDIGRPDDFISAQKEFARKPGRYV